MDNTTKSDRVDDAGNLYNGLAVTLDATMQMAEV